MQHINNYPFERNRYYYGKLLTEQDFIQEQNYMNNKRQLQNRFLHGVGVVAGLQVVRMDEKSISIEDGVAIDFAGREIIVDTPTLRKVSAIDGFDTIMSQNHSHVAYLCMEYEEHGEMPAHNIASNDPTFDKTKESYHFYLTDREPEQLRTVWTHRTETVYEDTQIRITQTVPRFVASGETFDVTITIENLRNAISLSVEIEESLECGLVKESDKIHVSWRNILLERGESNSKTITVHAMNVLQGQIRFSILPQNICLTQDTHVQSGNQIKTIAIPLHHQRKLDAIKQQYFHDKMEEINSNPYPIYLAKLILLKTEDSYLLEKVECMPFDMYVYSTQLLASMTQTLQQEIEQLQQSYHTQHMQSQKTVLEKPQQTEQIRTSQGSCVISLGVGGKREQRFFSHEIFHGLGLGAVKLHVAIQQDNEFYFGSGEIFKEMDVKAELAVKLDATKGSFVIGVRLIEPTKQQQITVHWWAEVTSDTQKRSQTQHLYIVPDTLELKIRETYHLQTICKNVPNATILWRVNHKNGGSILADGTYTAPNVAGVYEIIAQCQEVPTLKDSLFVVVRE